MFNFERDLIAFESMRTGNRDIYVMTTDGSEVVNITKHAAADERSTWGKLRRRTIGSVVCAFP